VRAVPLMVETVEGSDISDKSVHALQGEIPG